MYKLKFSTMKKSIIFCLLILFGITRISYAQDVAKETPVLTAQQQEAVDAMISMDPKLSAKEIEELKIAVLGAPADAEPLSDPKFDEQTQIMLAPVDADPIEQREALVAPVTALTTNSGFPSGTQAYGGKQENVVNLNSLSITGAVQLEAPRAETVTTNNETTTTQGTNPQAVPQGN